MFQQCQYFRQYIVCTNFFMQVYFQVNFEINIFCKKKFFRLFLKSIFNFISQY